MSGFDHYWKNLWLGDQYMHPNQVKANFQDKSNISNIRTHFRHTNLMRELNYIAKRSGMAPKVRYNDANGRSIGYISLAGHTFPDPRALEEMLQGMFQRSKELDE